MHHSSEYSLLYAVNSVGVETCRIWRGNIGLPSGIVSTFYIVFTLFYRWWPRIFGSVLVHYFTKLMALRKTGQSDILMNSQTVCMHSNSLCKKGQSVGSHYINCFGKSYWNNLCSLSSHIGLLYTLLFHWLFKAEFDIDHFVLGEHRWR